MITGTGTLTFGIEYEGAVHTDFEIRLPMIGDNIAALEEVGADAPLKLHAAMLARTIVHVGTIPAEVMTYDFLSKNLVDDDFDVLAAAEKDLKKKRKALNQPSRDTASPLPSSLATESTSPASVA
ncbi:hypothetical protein [Paraburkholderia unamae]|uniref:Tail assembly chaperone E/41/14-like protein n=1 Tax=Paraburkholderia unamae TaxID=219649 RepID=A0ABX5KHY9_9BURK|nr:hypothetical protein [Paraburkholderia unamae]PVX80055.1 hypothetical protein C7402_112242 [Paraburkholderia unamae]